MDLRFAENTAMILHMLPNWFKERKGSAESLGARFLNIAGISLDDLRYVIDYAYQQCYIDTADIDQVDYCYKAIIPMPLIADNVTQVFAYGENLVKASSLKQFFGIDQNIRTKNLNGMNTYYVDKQRNIIYVRDKFNVDANYSNGCLKFIIDDKEYVQELIPHQVWNFFDEFGLLLCTPRIRGENNQQYKERLKDVFKNPANASRDGLINGIARELDIRRTLTWNNPSIDLELEDPMVVINSIKIDGKFADLSKVFITESNTILLKAIQEEKEFNQPVEVSYAYGLEMHKLWNHEDTKIQNELFTIDYKPKYELQKYIEILDSECPIFWNSFHWNEHYWDPNEYDVTGYGTIPTLFDGSILGFRNYKG